MLSLSVVLALTLAGSPAAGEAPSRGFLIVAHPELRVTSVSRAELEKIFLGRVRTWSDGTPTVPVDQLPDRAVRQRFSREIHRRSVVTIEVYWKKQVYSGRDGPPKEVANDEEVLAFVRAHPGAVGYVSPSTEAATVRRLAVTD